MVLLYCGRVGRRREFYTRKKPVHKTGFRVLWPFYCISPWPGCPLSALSTLPASSLGAEVCVVLCVSSIRVILLTIQMNWSDELTANAERQDFFMMESADDHGRMGAEFSGKLDDILLFQRSVR